MSVAEHSYLVAMLAAAFARQLLALGVEINLPTVIEGALWHDIEEGTLGDTPHPVKRRWIGVAKELDRAQVEVREALSTLAGAPMTFGPAKGTLEALVIKTADWVELVLHVVEERLCGNRALDPAAEKILLLLETKLADAAAQFTSPVPAWYARLLLHVQEEYAHGGRDPRKPLTFLEY